jgi:hypothetical protein
MRPDKITIYKLQVIELYFINSTKKNLTFPGLRYQEDL